MPHYFSTLRRRCQAVVDTLDLPRPFSADTFCAHLSRQRRRPINVHAFPPAALGNSACGLWLATETDDHIFFETRTTPLHQEHIIMHEIAHLLFDHGSSPASPAAGLADVFTDLSPGTVRRLLGRTSYTTVQEQEAEMLASLIKTAADRPRSSPSAGVLGNLEAALGVGGPHAR